MKFDIECEQKYQYDITFKCNTRRRRKKWFFIHVEIAERLAPLVHFNSIITRWVAQGHDAEVNRMLIAGQKTSAAARARKQQERGARTRAEDDRSTRGSGKVFEPAPSTP